MPPSYCPPGQEARGLQAAWGPEPPEGHHLVGNVWAPSDPEVCTPQMCKVSTSSVTQGDTWQWLCSPGFSRLGAGGSSVPATQSNENSAGVLGGEGTVDRSQAGHGRLWSHPGGHLHDLEGSACPRVSGGEGRAGG